MVASGARKEEMDTCVPSHRQGTYYLHLQTSAYLAPAVGSYGWRIVDGEVVGPIGVVEFDVGETELLNAYADAYACQKGVVFVPPAAEWVEIDTYLRESSLSLVGTPACDVVTEAVTQFEGGVVFVFEVAVDSYLILLPLRLGCGEGIDEVTEVEFDVHSLPQRRRIGFFRRRLGIRRLTAAHPDISVGTLGADCRR